MKYLYIVQGYKKMNYKGELQDVVPIKVFAKTENEALTKAKKLVSKPHYRIGEVVEFEKGIGGE